MQHICEPCDPFRLALLPNCHRIVAWMAVPTFVTWLVLLP